MSQTNKCVSYQVEEEQRSHILTLESSCRNSSLNEENGIVPQLGTQISIGLHHGDNGMNHAESQTIPLQSKH